MLCLQTHKIIHCGGIEVGNVGYLQPAGNNARAETELDFVVRVDKIVCVLQHMEMLVAQNPLETLDTDTCGLDIHKSVDSTFGLMPQAEKSAIDRAREKVQPRQVREEAVAANLLMTAKGVAPNGKTEEDDGMSVHKTLHIVHELLLMGDMLNHITEYNKIKFPKIFGTYLVDIVTYKVDMCGVGVSGKACFAHVYLGPVYVYPHAFAPHIHKWKQVSRFAAAYLQDAHSGGNGTLPLYIGDDKPPHTLGLFVEITVMVFMSLLHRLID